MQKVSIRKIPREIIWNIPKLFSPKSRKVWQLVSIFSLIFGNRWNKVEIWRGSRSFIFTIYTYLLLLIGNMEHNLNYRGVMFHGTLIICSETKNKHSQNVRLHCHYCSVQCLISKWFFASSYVSSVEHKSISMHKHESTKSVND